MRAYPRLQKVAAALVGTTLFVSGSFKMMDPVGTGLILDEYWKLFGMEGLAPASLVLGSILSLFETLLGVAVVTGLFRKTVRWTATALIGLFTLVTVYLAVKNPAMDCGCFGEWIHLSHTASLVKNLILLALCLISLLPRVEPPSRRPRYIAAGLLLAGVAVAAVYCLRHIPPKDYTEFVPGVELTASQAHLFGEEEDYRMTMRYERDGQFASFPLEEIDRAEAEGWTFVEVDTLERTPSHALDELVTLSFLDRADRVADTLAVQGLVFIVSVYDTDRMEDADWRETAVFLRRTEAAGCRPLLLVSTPLQDLDARLPADVADYIAGCSYLADRRKLLALNRDNGGASYFVDGMLVMKWSRRDLPSDKELAEVLQRDPTEAMMASDAEGRMMVHGYFLYALAIALLL